MRNCGHTGFELGIVMILYAIKSRRKVSQSLFKNRKQRFYQKL